jgi:hypothetical protein
MPSVWIMPLLLKPPRKVTACPRVSLSLLPHLSTVGLCHICSAQLKSFPQLSGYLGTRKSAEWKKVIFRVWDKFSGVPKNFVRGRGVFNKFS